MGDEEFDELRDEQFWKTIQNKTLTLVDAADAACKLVLVPAGETLQGGPWGPLPAGDTSHLTYPQGQWYAALQPFASPSLDACERCVDTLTAGDGPRRQIAKKFGQQGEGGQAGDEFLIFNKLEDWEGDPGSAAYKFKYNWLHASHNALQTQGEVVSALAIIADAHGAIIRYARQEAINIVDATIDQLGGTAAERKKRAFTALENAASGIPALVKGAATGGPVGLALSAIELIAGDAISFVVTEAFAPKPWDKTEAMEKNLKNLETDVRERSSHVRSALDKLEPYLMDEEILPPDVNVPH